MCYHIVSIAIQENLTVMPLKFINVRIEPKAKRGRKRKVKGGEALQKPKKIQKK